MAQKYKQYFNKTNLWGTTENICSFYSLVYQVYTNIGIFSQNSKQLIFNE